MMGPFYGSPGPQKCHHKDDDRSVQYLQDSWEVSIALSGSSMPLPKETKDVMMRTDIRILIGGVAKTQVHSG